MIERVLTDFRVLPEWRERIVATWTEDSVEAAYGPWPGGVPLALREVLSSRGIENLYSHQSEAAAHALAGRDVVLATPTASGKSLAYNLPVLSSMLERASDDRPRALYLFPTKALSQDQTSELNELNEALAQRAPQIERIGAFTYDGDTPKAERRILRDRGEVVITNPYMLHVAILPNHMRWGTFFRQLRFVVLDELHTYTGVFGASVANVLRRLRRVVRHYGSDPVFIACSATIGNPEGHFEQLIEKTPVVIRNSGAPRSAKSHVFYNPPVVNAALGLRARAIDEARRLARSLLTRRIPSIFFGRSRTAVEVLTKYLKDLAIELGIPSDSVVGYRGGYLPHLRRKIEQGLRAGRIQTVVATNALELGVDIGSLDAVVMVGYPGSVSSYHQQSGRAGRRSGQSLSVLIGTSAPLDQYVMGHPEHVRGRQPVAPGTDPDNLILVTRHLQCACFELPFRDGESFGRFPSTGDLLDALAVPKGVLLKRGDTYHWMSDSYPAEEVPLDAIESDTFLVLEEAPGQRSDAAELASKEMGQGQLASHARSLGHVDRAQAMTTLHPQAIYQHQGVPYQVTSLDWAGRRAYAKRVAVDWYTEAQTETEISVLYEDERGSLRAGGSQLLRWGHGEVHLSTIAPLFKRIRFYTNENLETGPIDLPPEEMETTAFFLVLSPFVQEAIRMKEAGRAQVVVALAAALRGVAPLFVQMGRGALKGKGYATHPHWQLPAVILHDVVPGGIGLAEGLYRSRLALLAAAYDLVLRCPCRGGCPSCIGIGSDLGRPAKDAVKDLLKLLCGGSEVLTGTPGESEQQA
jgi:DEAD/DEAH box helicase domain-containing protein